MRNIAIKAVLAKRDCEGGMQYRSDTLAVCGPELIASNNVLLMTIILNTVRVRETPCLKASAKLRGELPQGAQVDAGGRSCGICTGVRDDLRLKLLKGAHLVVHPDRRIERLAQLK